jgi:hypothetical protein
MDTIDEFEVQVLNLRKIIIVHYLALMASRSSAWMTLVFHPMEGRCHDPE